MNKIVRAIKRTYANKTGTAFTTQGAAMLDRLPLPIWRLVFNVVKVVPIHLRGRLWWAVWRAL